MFVTNLKAKKIKSFFKIQGLALWLGAATTMEGMTQTCASVLGMEEMRKKRTAAAFLCCRLITVGSWLELIVIEPNHCRLLAWTGSDKWPPKHCWCKPQTNSDSCHHYRFGHIPNQFLVFGVKNRQWRVNIVDSPNSGSDEAGSEVLFCSSVESKNSKPKVYHTWFCYRQLRCNRVHGSCSVRIVRRTIY